MFDGWANCADATIKAKAPLLETFSWNDGFLNTSPVGSFIANNCGLCDMIGNAAQICSDKRIRGGSWIDGPRFCRSGSRHPLLPSTRGFSIGFRVVRDED